MSAKAAELKPLVKPGPKKTLPKRHLAEGPFKPDWGSLAAGYQTPDWFRDAKFGIWAHWGPQCEPEASDWYARNMYIQGSDQYKDHLKRYGHPSEQGFKDIIREWKAERWDPAKLIALYKAAGAKYFMALANHHDNFDNYDSTYQEWNSVRLGPGKDIVGGWAKEAKAQGLRFGVSNHSAHTWHWYQTAYGYDPEGPKAGVRYDGWLTKAAGKGKWWEGLDPQELYGGVNLAPPPGIKTAKEMEAWHGAHSGQWNEEPPANNPYFVDKWFLRCQELVDKYDPDMVYFDDTGLPLGQAGLDLAAHYYNESLKRRGKMEAVVNAKGLAPERRKALVEDYERGAAQGIQAEPWQTDTCLGNWHYDAELFKRHGYKSAAQILRTLVDVVSKNGNLLLSVPLKGDGTLDPDELAILKELAEWMPMNGEAIFASRPWKIHGEGRNQAGGGMFSERDVAYTSRDFRFTTKGGALYATAMARPQDNKLVIRSLAKPNPIRLVELLGYAGRLKWSQDKEGLKVEVPANAPGRHTLTLKIHGKDLSPVPFEEEATLVKPDATGALVADATLANLHGMVLEAKHDIPNLGYWSDAAFWASWQIQVPKAGSYVLSASCATISDSLDFEVELDGQKLEVKGPASGAWDVFKEFELGRLTVKKAGIHKLIIRAHSKESWKPMNLRWIRLQAS